MKNELRVDNQKIQLPVLISPQGCIPPKTQLISLFETIFCPIKNCLMSKPTKYKKCFEFKPLLYNNLKEKIKSKI